MVKIYTFTTDGRTYMCSLYIRPRSLALKGLNRKKRRPGAHPKSCYLVGRDGLPFFALPVVFLSYNSRSILIRLDRRIKSGRVIVYPQLLACNSISRNHMDRQSRFFLRSSRCNVYLRLYESKPTGWLEKNWMGTVFCFCVATLSNLVCLTGSVRKWKERVSRVITV